MGSLAVDKEGNMALGYSASSATLNPEIRYNGRLASDPLNTLPQGEATLAGNPSPVNGTQSGNCGGSTCIRWGDYSAMTLDPDGCTFWYTQEYYAANGLNWHTRVGAFRFDNAPSPDTCVPSTTAVSVARLTATRSTAGVVISWRTSSETSTVGFSVWRAGKSGTWRRVNPALIPAKRLGQVTGSTYRFRDRTALPEQPYNYRLQVRERGGNRSWYGIAAVPAAR
jgi:hypothetical protein